MKTNCNLQLFSVICNNFSVKSMKFWNTRVILLTLQIHWCTCTEWVEIADIFFSTQCQKYFSFSWNQLFSNFRYNLCSKLSLIKDIFMWNFEGNIIFFVKPIRYNFTSMIKEFFTWNQLLNIVWRKISYFPWNQLHN